MSGTVLFLGAGATAAVGGLTTDGILPAVYMAKATLAAQDSTGGVLQLLSFLQQTFHVPFQYPSLPLLMSLIDTALDRRELFLNDLGPAQLADLREGLEFAIFDVLEESLRKAGTNTHYPLLSKAFPGANEQPTIITTNYDLIADAALISFSMRNGHEGRLPNYHCNISNLANLNATQRFGSLLKLHGSLHWLTCKTCSWLDLGHTASLSFATALQSAVAGPDLRSSLQSDGALCPLCGQTKLRPLLVAPSHLKDYRNPHLAQVWYEAQRVLRGADRIIFVGYSMPDDDVEVAYLLKRSLAHLTDPARITVIVRESPAQFASATRNRYQALFGNIDWHQNGLDEWLGPLHNTPGAPGTEPQASLQTH